MEEGRHRGNPSHGSECERAREASLPEGEAAGDLSSECNRKRYGFLKRIRWSWTRPGMTQAGRGIDGLLAFILFPHIGRLPDGGDAVPLMAMAPSFRMRRSPSRVRTVPFSFRISTVSAIRPSFAYPRAPVRQDDRLLGIRAPMESCSAKKWDHGMGAGRAPFRSIVGFSYSRACSTSADTPSNATAPGGAPQPMSDSNTIPSIRETNTL